MGILRPISPNIALLLERVGCRAASGEDAVRLLYLKIGKWLVRPDSVALFLGRRGVRLSELVRFRPLCLRLAKGIPWYSFILPRDKEFTKLSLFSLDGQYKKVVWGNTEQFHRELSMMESFAARGFAVPKIIDKDERVPFVKQELIGKLFDNYCTPLQVSELLLQAHLGSVGELFNISYYSDVEICLGDLLDSVSLSERIKRLILASGVHSGDLSIPGTLVHGDPHAGNFFRDSDNTVYVTDFDRAFKASIFYDFVYLHLKYDMYTRPRLMEAIGRINTHFKINTSFSEPELYLKLLTLFALDSCVYLQSHGLGKTTKSRSWKRFTIRTIKNALDKAALNDLGADGRQ